MKIFLLIKKSGNLCGIFVISTPAVNFGQNPELVENYHNKRVLDLPVLAVLVFTKRWQDHRHNIVRAARSGLALASLGGGKYRCGTFWCCSSGMWCWSQERQDVTMGSSRPLHIHYNWSGASLVWSYGAELPPTLPCRSGTTMKQRGALSSPASELSVICSRIMSLNLIYLLFLKVGVFSFFVTFFFTHQAGDLFDYLSERNKFCPCSLSDTESWIFTRVMEMSCSNELLHNQPAVCNPR